jgi:amino acid adenylation domain-containing protein
LLVERLKPARSTQYSPLFQVMFSMNTASSAGTRAAVRDVRFTPFAGAGAAAKFELTFNASDTGETVAFSVDYNTDLFEAGTIARLARHLDNLLAGIAADPATPVHALPLLDDAERKQLLHALNGGRHTYAQDQCIHELFAAQAARTPQHIAVTCEGEQLSYDELNTRANRLAHWLRDQGVGADRLVGLCMERCVNMVVAILGILKAGGAYVPLDPAYPDERLAYMAGNSALALVLTQRELADKAAQLTQACTGLRAEQLDSAAFAQLLQAYPSTNPARCADLSPASLAYIIYTSGSTGKPKGVMIEHRNVGRLFASSAQWFDFGPQDVWTLFHSYGFDFSVWEIWGALLHGGRLVVVPQWVARSAGDFYALLCREKVTVLNQTPSAFAALIAVDTQQRQTLALRHVIFGGEALNIAALAPWAARHGDAMPRLINMYGITETTVHVTYRRLTLDDIANASNPSVIGAALPDLSALVLTPALSLAPQGVTGELYIGGAGLARGYLHRPELTAERFIAHPFSDDPSARLYKTGDLARYLPDGNLEYLGRIDDQVKIRGFRIELGEIENRLTQHAQVKAAVVLVREDVPGEKRLVAYVLAQAGADDTLPAQLKTHLQAALPEHMVPAGYVVLDAFPLTANGKVDKRVLLLLDPSLVRENYVAPRTDTEREIVDIWSSVLDVERIGIHDNFFALGGHSLLAVKALSRLKSRFNASLSLQFFFEAPTVAQFAACVEQTSANAGHRQSGMNKSGRLKW